MNIDDLTLGNIKEIMSLNVAKKETDPFLGKYVICRCYSAGVHAGYFVEQKGDVVLLKDSRRLYTWGSDGGIALSGVAQLGMIQGKKVDVVNPLIRLTGVVETILTSKIAEDSINEYR